MIIDSYINRKIGEKLLTQNLEEEKNHISSGKLTASMLGQPLQWQILKIKGIKGKPFDEYSLRKFKRGNDIEKWFVEETTPVETQKQANYRGVIGYIDAIVDTQDWEFPVGIIPLEVKSVANSKYKWIEKQKGPDHSHLLQACLYALSEKTDQFAIAYIASDDLRIHLTIHQTADYKDKVDKIIDRFNKQLATGEVPVFVPEEPWQENVLYNNYPDWAKLTEEEIEQKLKEITF